MYVYYFLDKRIKDPLPQHAVGKLYFLQPEEYLVKCLKQCYYDSSANNWVYEVRYKGTLIQVYERELRETSPEGSKKR